MNIVDMAMICENHKIQKNIKNMVIFVLNFFNSEHKNIKMDCSGILLVLATTLNTILKIYSFRPELT